jgi:hypothetical protein
MFSSALPLLCKSGRAASMFMLMFLRRAPAACSGRHVGLSSSRLWRRLSLLAVARMFHLIAC